MIILRVYYFQFNPIDDGANVIINPITVNLIRHILKIIKVIVF
jgi:hypothetical protein